MNFTLKSRLHGEQHFWANSRDSGSSYVKLGDDQICEGGGFRGITVMCDGTQEGLEKEARKWWRQKMDWDRKFRLY